MAGGDHHAAMGLLVNDCIGDHRRRHIGIAQPDPDVVACQYLGNSDRVAITEEAGVKADNQGRLQVGGVAALLLELFVRYIGKCLGNLVDIFKRKIFADDSSPTVCTKLDRQSFLL